MTEGGNGRSCAPAATSRLSASGFPASYFACIHVPAPLAGSWGYFAHFDSVSAYECGVKVASITGLPTDGTADALVKLNCNGTAIYVPGFTAAHVTGE